MKKLNFNKDEQRKKHFAVFLNIFFYYSNQFDLKCFDKKKETTNFVLCEVNAWYSAIKTKLKQFHVSLDLQRKEKLKVMFIGQNSAQINFETHF